MDDVGQLLAACEEGSVETVESLLDQGMCVDSTDESEITPLQVAAANGHEQLVRQLLMRGAALDKPNAMGWTPLLHAARYGHIHVASRLLQNQADINARTKLGANAIMLAARGGHLPTCKCLVEAGIDLCPSTGVGSTACEFTPVMAAAHYGHDTVVRYLLDRGFDVNSRTPSMGVSALMLTALNGHMTTAQVLIERGADPNFTNVNAQTALDIATARGHREVHGYLDRKTSNKPRHATEDVKPDIIEAVKQGVVERIDEILRDDVMQRDACSPEDGATPLMFAAMTGRLDICQLLLKSGCDINKQDTVSGWTALMQGIYHGKKAVAKFLINAGADVLIPAKNGCTAFDMASLIDDVDTELYRLMAAKAVQINRAEKKSKTWSNSSRQSSTVSAVNDLEHKYDARNVEQQKNGLKAWWSRMSNRFRNLKLGRTFNFNTNRLAPLPVEGNGSNSSSDTILKRSPALSNHLTSTGKKGVKVDVTEMTSAISTITSYDTLLLESQESAAVYTLGINSVSPSIQDRTIKPVIPPFLPPPTFETDRPKMPPVSSRRSIASFGSTSTLTSARPIVPPVKLLQSYSTQNLASTPASPSASLRLQHSNNASPSSSGGASGVSLFTRSRSSATSSTLTAGSDRKLGSLRDSSSSTLQPQHHPINSPNFLAMHHNYYRSTNASSSHTRSRGGSSKDTSSTLTPMTAHTPRAAYSGHGNRISPQPTITVADDDDLSSILKVLSLERYQPIFEEQEVDMEAFLTLTENDLQEIGISQETSRNQILSAISELNSGKGRERQNYQEYMSQFDTMYLRNAGSDTADCWSMQEDDTRPTDLTKPCVS